MNTQFSYDSKLGTASALTPKLASELAGVAIPSVLDLPDGDYALVATVADNSISSWAWTGAVA